MEINTIQKNISQTWLANLIEIKTRSNPNFSLRAFARVVSVSPAVLSRILNGKRNLTLSLAIRIADALMLGPDEREVLYSNFISKEKNEIVPDIKAEKELSIDCYNAMKDWYHYGITQLLYVKNFKEDYKWMANMLAISELQAKLAVDRLLRLEILERDINGILLRTNIHLSTSTEIASAGIRNFQKQILEKTIQSLENDDVNERDITSITLAINENKIKEVKAEIKKFRLKMSEFMCEGEKTRIYNLGIHLVPLSKSSNTNYYNEKHV